MKKKLVALTPESKAFIRGFAAAAAMTTRHQTNIVDLLRSISATEALLHQADVDDYDIDELRPAFVELRRLDRLSRAKS